MSLEQVKKHLQGRHNQSSHTPKKGSGKSKSTGVGAKQDKLKADVRAARAKVMKLMGGTGSTGIKLAKARGELKAAQAALNQFNNNR